MSGKDSRQKGRGTAGLPRLSKATARQSGNGGKLGAATQPRQPPSCPECGSSRPRKTKTGYLCGRCGFRFSESLADLQVKVDISGQVLEKPDPGKDFLQGDVFQGEFSVEPSSEDLPLERREYVASHVSSRETIAEKGLYAFPDHNRERRVCAEEDEAKNLVTVETLRKGDLPTGKLKTIDIPSLSNLKVLVDTQQYTISRDPEIGNIYVDLREGKFGKLKDQILCQVATPDVKNVSTDFIVKTASDVIEALSPKQPKLAEFVLSHSSTMTLASSVNSPGTLESYAYWLEQFSRWAKTGPNELVNEAKAKGVDYINETIYWFLTKLLKENLAKGTVRNAFKGTKAFYQANFIKGVELLPQIKNKLRRTTKFDDVAPVQEDLVSLWDRAPPREKVAISMMTLGGFRPHTLVKLKYRHIRKDFEQGRNPVHIHVEAEINKGEYTAYDTFIGSETIEALKMYFDARRKGTRRTPAEEIVDESPILRNEFLAAKYLRKGKTAPGITTKRLGDVIRELYYEAGLISKPLKKRRYNLRPYSLRKFFKTQLEAKGVKTIYVEHMMGHTRSPYDKTSIEFMRAQYASADLRLKPKQPLDDQFYLLLEDFIKSHGQDPNIVAKELARRSMTRPQGALVTSEDIEGERRELIRDSQRIGQRFFPETAERRVVRKCGEKIQ